MKINQLLFLIFAPVALHSYTVDDLESAIKESNESRVEEIVKNVQVTENDKKRILILAQDMVEQRKIKYQSLFVANDSFLRFFDYSLLKMIALVGGAGLIFSGIIMDIIMKKTINVYHYESTIQSFSHTYKEEENMDIPMFTPFGLLSATIINFGVRLKYFYDTKKLYDRAINIKQQIYKLTESVC